MAERPAPRPPSLALSRRAQRQSVVKEIVDQFIDGASENEILENVDENNVNYAKKLLKNLDLENSRVQSCSGLLVDSHAAAQTTTQQRARQPTIDKFLKKNLPHPSHEEETETYDQLQERLQHLKKENEQLETELEKSEAYDVLQNLIRLALEHFEQCRAMIIQKYNDSRNYEMIKQQVDGRTQQTCEEFLQNEARIRDINRQLEELCSEITQTHNISLQTAYRELKAQLTQEMRDAKRQASIILEGIQNNQILLQQYKFLTEMNCYRGLQLPTFYPSEAGELAALASYRSDYEYHGEKYLLLQLIGKGGFSLVYKAFNIRTSRFVALKVTQIEIVEGGALNQKQKLAKREAQIHQVLNHSNILKVYNTAVFQYNDAPQHLIEENYIEMELCDGLTLFEHICLKRYVVDINGRLPEAEALGILLQIASALMYLHSEIGVVHNDITLSNIIMSHGVWKISDFTLAKRGSTQQEAVTTLGCTLPYVAPEVERERQFSVRSDIFSLGVCVFGLLTGGIDIFQARERIKTTNLEQLARAELEDRGTVLYEAGPELVQLLIEMLDHDMQARPSAERIYEFCNMRLEAGSAKKLK